jgi:hypothetical protein
MSVYFKNQFNIPSSDYDHTQYEKSLKLEITFQDFTISTNAGTAEVPTQFTKVYGVFPLGIVDDVTADTIDSCQTDGTITAGAITVRVTTTSVADGTKNIPIVVVGESPAADA